MTKFYNTLSLFTILNLAYVGLSSICSDFKRPSNRSSDKFATKTGYFKVDKDDNNWENFLEQTSKCTKENVWFISRHGTRYPIGEDFRVLALLPNLAIEIEQNFVSGHGCLQQDDIDKYTGWIPPYEMRDKGQLHSQGAEELFYIGEHWRKLFPDIFRKSYNPKRIKVQFTVSNRTGQSAYHFLRGMYGDDAVGEIDLPEPQNPDLKLRFHKFCPKWMKTVYKNKKTYAERKLFENTKFFQGTLHAVSARLGFTIPLTKNDLTAMYEECRYETAWYPETASIWCKPFDTHDIQVLEFFQDLKYYYEDSYGTEMNAGMACETVADLLQNLRTGMNSRTAEKRSCVYFSHDKIMLHIFTSLGLFQPSKHLRHSDFEGSPDRIFRTSYMTPFASNLGFGLFKCEDGYKVATFFQGAPMYLKHICPELLCDWSLFENYISKFIRTCNFSKTCDMHDEL